MHYAGGIAFVRFSACVHARASSKSTTVGRSDTSDGGSSTASPKREREEDWVLAPRRPDA
ncbi:MAG: hypothetical protein DWH86_03340 [Planctomycetota bacterium]|nr:MAG: hypothetical protein DWH86_03340 [Planctomycetota bacterium]